MPAVSVRCAFGVIWRVSQIPKCGFSGRHAATEGEGRLLPGEPLRPPGGGRGWCPWSRCPARPPCAPFVLPRKLVRNRAPTPDSSPPGFSARRCRNVPEVSRRFSGAKRHTSAILVSRRAGRRRAWGGRRGGGLAGRDAAGCPQVCALSPSMEAPSHRPGAGRAPSSGTAVLPGPATGPGGARPAPLRGRRAPACPSVTPCMCACVSAGTPRPREAPPSRRRQGPEDEGFLHVSRQEHSGQASTASGLGALPRPRRRKPLTRGPPAASPRPFVSYFASRANGTPSRCLRVGKPGCGGRGAVRGLRRPPPRTRTPHGYAEAAAIASSWLCGILRDSVCGMRGRGRAVRPGEEPSGR